MLFLFALMIPYGILCFLGTGHIDTKPHDYRKGNPVVSITALIPITLLYCVFCGVQFVSLFMKRLPDGYTYSQYAREGFFELLAVCIINVALILIIQEFFQDHLLQKAILTITCLCTYIMLASSAYRILLYINAYGLTFLRIMVIWALIVIALLLLGLMTQIFWRHFPTMRYSIFVVWALYLALAFLHPDYIIADYNLSHDFYDSSYDQTLAQLSDDAAPALFRFYEEDPGQETLYHTYLSFALSHNLDYQDSFMKFNLSHYRAPQAIPPALQEYSDYGL